MCIFHFIYPLFLLLRNFFSISTSVCSFSAKFFRLTLHELSNVMLFLLLPVYFIIFAERVDDGQIEYETKGEHE